MIMNEPVYFNNKLFIHDIDGHRIFLDPNDIHMTIHMLENRVWEPQIREVIATSLKNGGVYVDVGANVGLHAVYAAGLVGSEGKVYAIEPNKDIYQILLANLDINGFLSISSLHNVAVSDSAGKGCMYIYPDHAGGSGFGKETSFLRPYKKQKVRIETVDDIVKNEEVDVLKIDVEGFEWDCINGAKRTIDNSKNITVILEWNAGASEYSNEQCPKILKMMASYGFRAYHARFMNKLRPLDINDIDDLLSIPADDIVFSRDDHLDCLC